MIISLIFSIAVISTLVFGFIRMSRIEERSRRKYHTRETVGRRCRSLAEDMGLSREKAARFERIMTGPEGKSDSVRAQLRETRGELFELIWSETPRYEDVMRKVDEVAALQGELERLLVGSLLEARSILDPEEEERFFKHMRSRMKGLPHHERRSPKEPHGNGGRR